MHGARPVTAGRAGARGSSVASRVDPRASSAARRSASRGPQSKTLVIVVTPATRPCAASFNTERRSRRPRGSL
mgnify:CR=1 FL=1